MKKLIRDKIPSIIERQGRQVNTEIVQNDVEYYKFLTDKLYEEVQELLSATTKESKIEEMADVLEVLDAICEFNKIDRQSVLNSKNKKLLKRGGFKNRIVLVK